MSPQEIQSKTKNALPKAKKIQRRASLYYIKHVFFNDKSNFYHTVALKIMS